MLMNSNCNLDVIQLTVLLEYFDISHPHFIIVAQKKHLKLLIPGIFENINTYT